MVTQEAIQKWQDVWKQLLDMAYYGKSITDSIRIPDGSEKELLELYKWQRTDPNFDKLTFDYMWSIYSKVMGEEDMPIEPLVVSELKHLRVPAVLFMTLGVNIFMKECFPNCAVTFWELRE